MTTIDPYRITDKLEVATLETIITRLESRGRHPRFARMLRDYLEAMHIDKAQKLSMRLLRK